MSEPKSMGTQTTARTLNSTGPPGHDGQVETIRVIAPTGCLGYGFSASDFRACMRDFNPHFVGVDAGSTDPGPYYLGAGESFTSRQSVRHELEVILEQTLPAGIPLVVGNAGGAGGRPHTEWVVGILRELAQAKGWTIRAAVIDSEVPTERLHSLLDQGKVHLFESDDDLTHDEIARARRTVAQMGPEPLMEALAKDVDVVVAGRTCDDAIFAAYPLLHGGDRALATYAGKVLECGALACEPIEMDVLMAEIGTDHVRFEPGAAKRRSTVASVTGHSLYERENPFLQYGPGGHVDLTNIEIEQDGERATAVRGVRFVADPYTLKLEGVRSIGFRAVSVAGVSDPGMIDSLDDVITEAVRRSRHHLEEADVAVTHLAVNVYGRDGVPLTPAPAPATPGEVGLVMEAIADTQDEAIAACHELSGTLLHINFPNQYNTAGNLAFPFSPSEMPAGEVFEFSIYHLVDVDDPATFASIREITLGGKE